MASLNYLQFKNEYIIIESHAERKSNVEFILKIFKCRWYWTQNFLSSLTSGQAHQKNEERQNDVPFDFIGT